jgi:hypothetical protein
MNGGFMEIVKEPGGQWVVKVDGRRKATTGTLDEALEHAAGIRFAPCETPGRWTIKIDPDN